MSVIKLTKPASVVISNEFLILKRIKKKINEEKESAAGFLVRNFHYRTQRAYVDAETILKTLDFVLAIIKEETRKGLSNE